MVPVLAYLLHTCEKISSSVAYQFGSLSIDNVLAKTLPDLLSCIMFLGEIDRCLKKVQEGVDVFEDLWQKVSSFCC